MSTQTSEPLRPSYLSERVRRYWNEHIHDLKIVKHPVGTLGFFKDLEEYRFDKLRYLPQVVNFNGYKGKKILEIGCGAGIDLVRFARGGADTVGIDLSETAIDLAEKNFKLNGLPGAFHVMDGEKTTFPDAGFDVVYAHGVLQYAANPEQIVREMHRLLKPGGEAIIMVYNSISWLNGLSKLMKTDLEHEDAPVLKKYSLWETKKLMSPFANVRLVPERFPVKSRLHGGLKGFVFNNFFVGPFNILPRFIVRPLGWHIMGFATK